MLHLIVMGVALAVEVPAGIYAVGDREVYVEAFEIADTVESKEGFCREAGLRIPTSDEWLIAAKHRDFKVSAVFEEVDGPASESCENSMAVLEAEGVEGWMHFAGWGGDLGQAVLLSSKGDPRAGRIRIHQNAWHFWGDDAKPSPRGERCVKAAASRPETAFVQKAPVTLLSKRNAARRNVLTASTGAQVTVFHRAGDWAYVSAEKRVPDDSGSEPRVWSCGIQGWVKQSSIGPDRATQSFEPGGDFDLATWCPGENAAWKECLLPWSSGGWVDLDLNDLVPTCTDNPDTPAHRSSAVKPKKLHLKIPAGEPDRDVMMRARTLLGDLADGAFTSKGYGPWREIRVKAYELEAGGGVLDVQMSEILDKAKHKVQVEISVTGLPVYAFDLIWPVSC